MEKNENNDVVGKVKWKRKLFSQISQDEKMQLFSHVQPGEKKTLFEHLDDRLMIQDGKLMLKKNYSDGIYPVLEQSIVSAVPKLEAAAISRTGLTPSVVVAHTVTEVPSFGSSNFGLRLLAVNRIIRENEGKESAEIRYVFAVITAWGNFRKEVKDTDVENFKWVQEATHGRAFFEERKERAEFSGYVHRVIEEGIGTVEMLTCYEQNGWKIIDGKACYVCDQGVIGNDNLKICSVSEQKFEILPEMSSEESIKLFLDMEKICKTNKKARVALIFTSMSVLTSLFEKAGFPIKTLCGIFGTTNTLKTSVALAFTNIFNAGSTHCPNVTFSSTRAGIETFVSKFADSVLLVDDFMPGDDKAKQAELNAKLELLCRLYGDRTSKKRMTVFSGKDVDFPVRGCCMITGEHLTGVESSRTRIVCIDLEKGEVDKECLTFYQENPLILPTYLYRFLEYMVKKPEETIHAIKTGLPNYRRLLKFHTARFNEAAAQFLVTVDMMVDYWRHVCPDLDIAMLEKKWKEGVLSIFTENDEKLMAVDTVGIILQALEAGMQNPSRVKPLENIKPTDLETIYADKEFIYIQQKDLYVLAKEFAAKYGLSFFLQSNAIAEKLKERDVLECVRNSSGHIESSRKLKQGKGVTKRFLYIKRAVMEKILEEIR